jgi:starch synthase
MSEGERRRGGGAIRAADPGRGVGSLRIACACAELVPFSKTGGLGDVTAALSAVLHRAGNDIRVFSPFYSTVETVGRTFTPVEELQDQELTLGDRRYAYTVFRTPLPGSGDPERGLEDLEIHLIHCPALYQRDSIYTEDPDEPLRFAFLSRAVVECCRRLAWSPDVFHVHDWHTALLPLYLKTVDAGDRRLSGSKTVLTIHNIGYQGSFDTEWVEALDLAEHAELLDPDDLRAGRLNFLETGIRWADLLTTVSRTHAREIQTPEYGFGLDGLLRERSDRLVGIVNGIDERVWNPETDRHLPFHYSAKDLRGKTKNKRHLCEELELPFEPGVPLLAIVSRLAPQKGFDLAREPLSELLERGALRLVVLGTGDPQLEESFRGLGERFADHAHFLNTYSERWAHRIEAAADLFLMPSRYEPCGLNQMYSQRYGTVPVVRKTGGLADTVEPWNPEAGEGTGFVFEHADSQGVRWALEAALETWGSPKEWRRLQRNGMAQDFSWQRRGEEYRELYRRLVGEG